MTVRLWIVIEGMPPMSLRRMLPVTLPTPAIDAENGSESDVPAGIELGVLIDVRSGAEPARLPEKLMIPGRHGARMTAIMAVANTARRIFPFETLDAWERARVNNVVRKVVRQPETARAIHHRLVSP